MNQIHRVYGWISPRFRRRRLRQFQARLQVQPADPLLDVGGFPWCWTDPAWPNPITLLNQAFPAGLEARAPGFTYVVGDGCALPFGDRAFAVLFSNSVIEHVGSWERQQRFAAEARRVGGRLWVQTPAREFFVEPHFLAPFFHWLSPRWQRRLARNFTPWGWFTRPTPAAVDAMLAEIRLLTRREMQQLFPDCEILEEKFLGLTKSHIAVRRLAPHREG